MEDNSNRCSKPNNQPEGDNNSLRRTYLKTVAGTGAAITGVSLLSSSALAYTDPSDAYATEYDSHIPGFGHPSTNNGPIRLYLTNKWETSDLDIVLDSVKLMMQNLEEATDKVNGWKIEAYNTNVDAFFDSYSGDPTDLNKQYIDEFGHTDEGGANLWIGDDGSMDGVTYSNNVWNNAYDTSETYPYASKHPKTLFDYSEQRHVSWSACHEIWHQLCAPVPIWAGNYDGESTYSHHVGNVVPSEHYDATVTTIGTSPGADDWKEGACRTTNADPSSNSVQISECEAGAVDDVISYFS
ncbi:hypothetical protein [Halorussus pelagicus]|uniref:hypothetical protein n=1 Tax=Halorussus pelagicus TaxID=2505977 RepID=UPI000FFC707A|nr:hypothetical protein [Halorussus pelagicus]